MRQLSPANISKNLLIILRSNASAHMQKYAGVVYCVTAHNTLGFNVEVFKIIHKHPDNPLCRMNLRYHQYWDIYETGDLIDQKIKELGNRVYDKSRIVPPKGIYRGQFLVSSLP
jgi:hypothetical protein